MISVSTDLRQQLLNSAGFNGIMGTGCALYYFAGPVPASADAALNMATDHTHIVKITNGGSPSGTVSFGNPVAGVISKTPSEDWKGTSAFDGADDSETTLTPTFYRLCATGDNGRLVSTSVPNCYRIQGTIGAEDSGADLELASMFIEDNKELAVDTFNYTINGA